MGILLAFSPFIAFIIVERIAGPTAGLAAGALVSAFLIARDALSRERSVKILELGTVILFAALTLLSIAVDETWSIAGVRLRVDAGLLCIVLISMLVGRPFTLQYAREAVSPEVAATPGFRRTNYVITAAWAAAFAVMVLADVLMEYAVDVPHIVGIGITIIALMAAVKFTAWYPEHVAGADEVVS